MPAVSFEEGLALLASVIESEAEFFGCVLLQTCAVWRDPSTPLLLVLKRGSRPLVLDAKATLLLCGETEDPAGEAARWSLSEDLWPGCLVLTLPAVFQDAFNHASEARQVEREIKREMEAQAAERGVSLVSVAFEWFQRERAFLERYLYTQLPVE